MENYQESSLKRFDDGFLMSTESPGTYVVRDPCVRTPLAYVDTDQKIENNSQETGLFGHVF